MWYSFVMAVGKRSAALALGTVVLWQVAEHTGPTRGRAVVHVATLPADLVVDGNVYRVEDLHTTPIICELRPGRHTAQLIRGEQVLYREEFTLDAGDEVILTAWDQFDDGRSPARAGGILAGAGSRVRPAAAESGSSARGAAERRAPIASSTGPLARHHAVTTSVRFGTWFIPDF
jgi:hypothetical protein